MFFVILSLIVIPLLIRVIWLLFIWSSTVNKLVKYLEGLLYWNFFIRIMFEIFLECTIASMIRINFKCLSFDTISDKVHSVLSIAMLSTMVLFMVGVSAFLYFNKRDIRSKKFTKRYGELT